MGWGREGSTIRRLFPWPSPYMRTPIKIANRLGHHLTPFTPYGDKEYAYCENPLCKARLIIQGDIAEGHALSYVCPALEGDGMNGGA